MFATLLAVLALVVYVAVCAYRWGYSAGQDEARLARFDDAVAATDTPVQVWVGDVLVYDESAQWVVHDFTALAPKERPDPTATWLWGDGPNDVNLRPVIDAPQAFEVVERPGGYLSAVPCPPD